MFEERGDERTRFDIANAYGCLSAGRVGVLAVRVGRSRVLRFAMIRVNQFRSRAWREPDVRPILGEIARLEGWTDHTRSDKLVETASSGRFGGGSRRDKLGDDATVRRDGDTLARFDPTDVATEVIFELANAG